jgi:hypothetical protein
MKMAWAVRNVGKYPFPYHKRKAIVFMVGRKDNNGWAITREIARCGGRYERRKITY